jgi:uncharacterized protein with PQ loop repeat
MFWHLIAILMTVVGATCFMPQVFRAFKRRSAKGLSVWFLIFCCVDKLLSLCYTIHLGDVPLMIKYTVGVICLGFLVYLKFTVKD